MAKTGMNEKLSDLVGSMDYNINDKLKFHITFH